MESTKIRDPQDHRSVYTHTMRADYAPTVCVALRCAQNELGAYRPYRPRRERARLGDVSLVLSEGVREGGEGGVEGAAARAAAAHPQQVRRAGDEPQPHGGLESSAAAGAGEVQAVA